MEHPINTGLLVVVTGDTAKMSHDFADGTVCKIVSYDESDSTYDLRSTEAPYESWWVHEDDVEEWV